MRCWIFLTLIKIHLIKYIFWGHQACGINNFTFLTFTLPHYGVGQKRNWVEAALRRPSSAVTVLGHPSPEKLLRVFYSPKLWVCQGAGLGRRSLRGLFDVTSLPIGVRSAGLLCREVLGVVWQRQPENKQGRVWALFSFSPLCSLHQTPSASQPAQIWYGAVVGNGLSGARYVFVALSLSARSAWSCRQKPRLRLEILWRAQRLQFQNWALSLGFSTIVYAHLCSNSELFQTRYCTEARLRSTESKRSHFIGLLL